MRLQTKSAAADLALKFRNRVNSAFGWDDGPSCLSSIL